MIKEDVILLVELMQGDKTMKAYFFLFAFLFCLCCNGFSLSLSPVYICSFKFTDDNKLLTSNQVKFELIKANQDESYGLYRLSNLGKDEIILQGWYEKEDVFTVYGHHQESWKLDIKTKNSKWESAMPALMDYAPPDRILSVKPNDSVVVMAQVQGINEFEVDLSKFAYRLVIKTKEALEILSEPYCFNQEIKNLK